MTDRLLTTRELQELLQLDRVTIYRMVKDGELPAMRVGGQWRFSSDAIDSWLNGQKGDRPTEDVTQTVNTDLGSLSLEDLVPVETLQTIQNQFAELIGVAAFITDLEGQPLAPCSRCSRFCQIIHSRPEGMAACQESWHSISLLEDASSAIHLCHAGIEYASAPVSVSGHRFGLVTAGQFFTTPPIQMRSVRKHWQQENESESQASNWPPPWTPSNSSHRNEHFKSQISCKR